jgi:hypothetical protein
MNRIVNLDAEFSGPPHQCSLLRAEVAVSDMEPHADVSMDIATYGTCTPIGRLVLQMAAALRLRDFLNDWYEQSDPVTDNDRRARAEDAVTRGVFIPADDVSYRLARDAADKVSELHAYIESTRTARQADNAVAELLAALR